MIREKIAVFRDRLMNLSIAYRGTFNQKSIHTPIVLRDLAKFCRAYESTFHPDPRVHAVLEGRREVWLRIQEYLELSVDEVYSLHKIREMVPHTREEN